MCVWPPGCPPGWFGANCVQRCDCSNGGVCDPATGNCTCSLGWTGEHCDRGATLKSKHPVSPFSRAPVSLLLIIASVISCSRRTWRVCVVMWLILLFFFSSCQFSVAECPAGKFGANCQLTCTCQNNGTCDRVTGMCQCGPGYYGHLCEHGEKGLQI